MPDISERRRAPRSRVMMSGKISVGEDGVKTDARVLNLSEYGALLVVSNGIPLPAHFKIKIRDTTYPTEVRWRCGQRIGVKFFVEQSREAEAAAYDIARELHEARVENKLLRNRESALLKKLAEAGYVQADEF